MATFMEELESSGLLADDAAVAGPDVAAAISGSGPPAAESAAAIDVSDGPVPLPDAETRGGGAATRTEQTSAELQAMTGSTAGPHPGADTSSVAQADGSNQVDSDGDGAGGGGNAEEAEQRVLGDLAGVDGWFEVMDMASRKARLPALLQLHPHGVSEPMHQCEDSICRSLSSS